MSKILSITNSSLIGGTKFLPKKIENLCLDGIDEIVLREKELSQNEYKALFLEVLDICSDYGVKLYLHNFLELALDLDYKFIASPLDRFDEFIRSKKYIKFDKLIISTHSLDEAIKAMNLGANAIFLSHIFQTKCKENLAPRGLELIREVRGKFSGEIYALGGINDKNFALAIENGANHIALMSEFMLTLDEKSTIQKYKR